MERSPWLEQFRIEGELRATRANMEEVLEARFPGAVPAGVLDTIRQATQLPLLKQGHRLAVTVKSPDEVRVFLQQGGKRPQ